MNTIADRLAELGLELPEVPAPAGVYRPATRVGDLVMTAGQLPLAHGELLATGHLGREVDVAAGAAAARQCALNAIAAAARAAGGLERLERVVKVTGFVASAPGFQAQPAVLNGASELLGEVFGEAGEHARSAVGVAELPMGAAVEVEAIFGVR